jgi:hypothetical protein
MGFGMYSLAAATVLLLGAASVQAAPAAERFSADSEDFAGFVSRQWNAHSERTNGGGGPQWDRRNKRPAPPGITVETDSSAVGKVSGPHGTTAKGQGAGNSKVKAQGGDKNFGAAETESAGTAENNGKNSKATGKSKSSGVAFSSGGGMGHNPYPYPRHPRGPRESPDY